MLRFLKFNKEKVKILLILAASYSLVFFVWNFFIGILIRKMGLEFYERMTIFNYFSNILAIFIVSYAMFLFVKYVLRAKMDFKGLMLIFATIFILGVITNLILSIFSKVVRPEIYFSGIMQPIEFCFGIILFYIAACFISKFAVKK